jgi:hypothetical protein
MELTRSLDIYCERMGPGYWAEPLNAVSNIAFLIAAYVMWRRVRGQGMPLAVALCWVLAAIGVGSYLWHTHAQVWAVMVDSGAIAVFAVLFVFAANRHFLGLSLWRALGLTALFFPYVALTVPLFDRLPFFEISSGYWPLPLLMLIYGIGLRNRAPETGRGLLIAGGLVTVSLTLRSVDEAVCSAVPVGTHFLWHALNGLLLGWMIEVYRRHMVGGGGAAQPA